MTKLKESNVRDKSKKSANMLSEENNFPENLKIANQLSSKNPLYNFI